MKKYTLKELRDFCERAVEGEDCDKKCEVARRFISSRPYLSKAEKESLLEYLDYCMIPCDDFDDGGDPFLPDYLDRDSRDYSPSNPWDAPGMRVSDFITGVRFY